MSTLGQAIIARSISGTRIPDQHGNLWQYHSRSDGHSKIACWAIMFDLLQACPLLRQQVANGKVAFGINHRMQNFKLNKNKNLDLVLSGKADASLTVFADFVDTWGIILTDDERGILHGLPVLRKSSVSNVFLALEAKACMTEHIKAIPRLNDELTSSFQTIHGDTGGAIAAAFVMINSAESFISPDRHRKRIKAGKYQPTLHKQPHAAQRVIEAMMKIQRRSDPSDQGFDALAISMVACRNDHSPVEIDETANATVPAIATYDAFIGRLSHLYSTKYTAI